jgi:dethiobiotin synthetase
MNYFVTAIHTDSGKTLASAILCNALGADYWKPIQCGGPRDAESVARWIDPDKSKIHPDGKFLTMPASPHAAAKAENIELHSSLFHLPSTENNLVIEGAGGCLVPLNDTEFIIDFATRFNAEIVLVSNLYLGSINHTLLTWEALQTRKLKVAGIIFNGMTNAESERIILRHTRLPVLLRIKPEDAITKAIVEQYARELRENWKR